MSRSEYLLHDDLRPEHRLALASLNFAESPEHFETRLQELYPYPDSPLAWYTPAGGPIALVFMTRASEETPAVRIALPRGLEYTYPGSEPRPIRTLLDELYTLLNRPYPGPPEPLAAAVATMKGYTWFDGITLRSRTTVQAEWTITLRKRRDGEQEEPARGETHGNMTPHGDLAPHRDLAPGGFLSRSVLDFAASHNNFRSQVDSALFCNYSSAQPLAYTASVPRAIHFTFVSSITTERLRFSPPLTRQYDQPPSVSTVLCDLHMFLNNTYHNRGVLTGSTRGAANTRQVDTVFDGISIDCFEVTLGQPSMDFWKVQLTTSMEFRKSQGL
ncbi:hypothetical protein DFH06DRAFT_1128457 [Mycena polygramma]|nr:hypothetical protein DFH06DRAFT_1128457 [Mycena polygramma]